jgi:hypothetical protein
LYGTSFDEPMFCTIEPFNKQPATVGNGSMVLGKPWPVVPLFFEFLERKARICALLPRLRSSCPRRTWSTRCTGKRLSWVRSAKGNLARESKALTTHIGVTLMETSSAATPLCDDDDDLRSTGPIALILIFLIWYHLIGAKAYVTCIGHLVIGNGASRYQVPAPTNFNWIDGIIQSSMGKRHTWRAATNERFCLSIVASECHWLKTYSGIGLPFRLYSSWHCRCFASIFILQAHIRCGSIRARVLSQCYPTPLSPPPNNPSTT